MLRPIGWVESPLTELGAAPCQGDEGAPDCWLVFEPDVRPAFEGLRLRVQDLDAIDQTPIVDIKPVLGPRGQR